tara:strand:+ start:1218 stop:1850 length:633 start_codon:yes stop_codon:yes gene_type:complete
MDFKSILAISVICALGAISPGPSLAVVIRNTINGGRKEGVLTGVGHGLGLGIYALLSVMGISSLITSNKQLFNIIQIIGSFFLIFLASRMIFNKSDKELIHFDNYKMRKGFFEGFMISFLNPKILIFFTAVFSQFMTEDLTLVDKITMAVVAGVIDISWYVLVAIVLAGTKLLNVLKRQSNYIDKITGYILIILGILMLVKYSSINLLDL